MSQQRKSIYRRGAENGLVMGVFLSVLFLAMANSLEVAWLGLVSMVMVLSVPFLTYGLLRRSYRTDLGLSKFSELWMEGIVIFAGGSVIMAVVALAYMRWIEPSFIMTQVTAVADVYREAGETGIADMFDNAVAGHALPTPAEVAVELVWLGIFSGSMLSMLMTLLVKARRVDKR